MKGLARLRSLRPNCRSLSLFLLASILILAGAAAASERFVLEKILLVDMQRVLADSIVGKAAKSDLQSEVKKAQGAIQVRKLEIEKLKGDLEKKRGVLSEQSLSQKQEDILKREREISRSIEDSREEIARKTSQQMDKIIALAQEVIGEIAPSYGDVIVLERSSRLVVTAQEGLDITAEVIKLMDEKRVG